MQLKQCKNSWTRANPPPGWTVYTSYKAEQPFYWYFSDRASWIDYILITNLMHWLLFIHKILFSSTCFKPQVLLFRRIQLYTCSIWYCHSLREFVVACRYTAWVRTHVYNCILLKMSTWGSKHVEENNILLINNNQCIKLVINIQSTVSVHIIS